MKKRVPLAGLLLAITIGLSVTVVIAAIMFTAKVLPQAVLQGVGVTLFLIVVGLVVRRPEDGRCDPLPQRRES